MNVRSFERWAGLVAVGAAALFVGDLFLGWQKASVEVGTVVDVEATTSGLRGWGFLAGVFAVALIGLELDRLRSGTPGRRTAWVATAAVGLLVATALARGSRTPLPHGPA